MLTGRGAVVVGGTRGIGLAVAELLATHGARVIVNGRDEDAATAAAQRIPGVLDHPGSPADPAVADALIERCVGEFGRIDILINCAGTAEPAGSSILDVTSAQFHDLLNAHLGTTFETCRAAAPRMAAQGSGAIVNTSSFAFLGDYGGTGYPAGKGGVNSLSYAMAVDLKQHGVDVNVVCPGAKTRLSTGEDYFRQIESLHARGALSDERKASALNPASPDYVASLYAFLASDLARGVTGQVFWGSGGYIGRFLPNEQEVFVAMDAGASPPWEIEALWDSLSAQLD